MKLPKTPLQWANSIGSALVAVALITVIVLFMGPRLLGWQLVVVLSGSMEPTLPVGGVAFVEPRDASSVKVGDILTFRLPEDVSTPQPGRVVQVTHRVVEVVQQGQSLGFRTKGDANASPDAFVVPAANVVGVVHWHAPYVGFLADKLRTRLGFLLLVAVPGVLIIAGELRKIVVQVKAMRAKGEAPIEETGR